MNLTDRSTGPSAVLRGLPRTQRHQGRAHDDAALRPASVSLYSFHLGLARGKRSLVEKATPFEVQCLPNMADWMDWTVSGGWPAGTPKMDESVCDLNV